MPSLPRYVVIHKERGITPLEAIQSWKAAHSEHSSVPASYAGRLDPMAEGKLLVLLGEECKRQQKYRGLDKEYEIEVLLDVSTDTGDVLGMPALSGKESAPSERELAAVLREQAGTKIVAYPAFSSKAVDGKPLFQHALEGTLDSIRIPTHKERIYRMRRTATRTVPKQELEERIASLLRVVPRSDEPSKLVGADFRQDAIRAAWDSLFADMPDRCFVILSLTVACASGTYMRTLAERIGKDLGTTGMALSIRRTRIGKYWGGAWWRSFK